MARPVKYLEPRVPTAVRLPESLHRRLHVAARSENMSANALVELAITQLLDGDHRGGAEYDLGSESDVKGSATEHGIEHPTDRDDQAQNA